MSARPSVPLLRSTTSCAIRTSDALDGLARPSPAGCRWRSRPRARDRTKKSLRGEAGRRLARGCAWSVSDRSCSVIIEEPFLTSPGQVKRCRAFGAKLKFDTRRPWHCQGGMPCRCLRCCCTSTTRRRSRRRCARCFAHKRLAWGAVEQPSIMPKPELVPLTGGYRRIPVLQIGADVYCDTQLIVRVLERAASRADALPRARARRTAHAWNLWADRLLFMPVVAVVFADIGQFVPQGLHGRPLEDDAGAQLRRDSQAGTARARAGARAASPPSKRSSPTAARGCSGATFSLADAACYHPLWFLRVAPGGQALLAEFPRVAAWMARARGDGPGRPARRAGGRRARPGARRASRRRPAASSPRAERARRREPR